MTAERFAELQNYIDARGYVTREPRRIAMPRFRRMMEIDPSDVQSYLEKNGEQTFTELLFEFIDRTGQRDSDVYKKAFIDRRLFSKIRSNKNYTPAKKTVTALCLALELTRPEADRLLSAAGYSLSRADDYDLIIAFCIEKRIFDFFEINEALDRFGFETF